MAIYQSVSGVLSSEFADQLVVTASVCANRLRLNEDDLANTSAFTDECGSTTTVVQSCTNVAFVAAVIQTAGNKYATTVESRTNDQQSCNAFWHFNVEITQEIVAFTSWQVEQWNAIVFWICVFSRSQFLELWELLNGLYDAINDNVSNFEWNCGQTRSEHTVDGEVDCVWLNEFSSNFCAVSTFDPAFFDCGLWRNEQFITL
ncbi:hypothetical protein D3C75_797580 [compost metagenome]